MPHTSDPELDITDTEENSHVSKDKQHIKSKHAERSVTDPHEAYIATARTIARCIDLSCNVSTVISTVQLIQQDEASKCGELDEDEGARKVREECLRRISTTSKESATRTYYKILQIVPSLQELVDNPKNSAELAIVCGKMKTIINATRSNDAARLKNSIPRYALPDPNKPASLDPPIIISSSGRAELGLNHPIITRWLCPADQLEYFDKDPEQACKDLASGQIDMGPFDYPALFWSGKKPGDDYDPMDMCHGLFKSYLLVRIGRHIFLGPSSALGGDSRATRSCNAVLHNMRTVEAEHIAYARFGLSSKSQWSQSDGSLDYFKMYHGIIAFIQHSLDPDWRDDLLKWWNKELFGDVNGRSEGGAAATGNENQSGSGAPSTWLSTVERLNAQMKAWLAARDPAPAISPTLQDGPRPTSAPSQLPIGSSSSVEQSTRFPADPSAVPRLIPPTDLSLSASYFSSVTPRPAVQASSRATSPLTETEHEEPDAVLTPIVNRKAKQTKGKRPAPVTHGDGTASGGRTKRSRRNQA